MSIRSFTQVNIKRPSLQKNLKKNFHLKGYNIQLIQELKANDHEIVLPLNKNSFSDEAHFEIGRSVNKQNCRIWVRALGLLNDRVYDHNPQHRSCFKIRPYAKKLE